MGFKLFSDFKIKNGVLVKYRGKDSNVVIPSNVTTIGDEAFYKCESITSITIPNSVTRVGTCAFDGCSSLQSITISNSVTSIGNDAFKGCKSLQSITIPSSVTSIGAWAFNGCTSLESITIPNSVTRIGDWAFNGCTSLQSITIPISATSIGVGICARCTQLKQINVEESNANYISIDGNLYTKDGKTLIQYAIGKKDTSFTIPSSVTSIGYCAFLGCTSLTSITIPSSVKSIGEEAFVCCENLKTVYNLSKLDIKKGAKTHGYVGLYADNVYTELPNSDFDIQDGVLVKYKGNGGNIVIPNTVDNIGDNAFYDCKSLVSIIIPDSVIRIGDWAFCGCTSLSSITIPNSVTSIGDYAFAVCENLKTIFNHSALNIQKGAETHGYVAYYADNVFNDNDTAVDK